MNLVNRKSPIVNCFLLLIIAMIAMAQTPLAFAQTDPNPYAGQSFTVPTVIVAGTSNLPTATVIPVGKFQKISLEFTSTQAGTTGCTNQWIFQPSVSGIYYDTNAASAITCSNIVIGAVGAVCTTRIQLTPNADGYWKLAQVITTGSSSNNIGYYSVKIGRP